MEKLIRGFIDNPIIILIISIIIIVLLFKFFKPKIKGIFGEMLIRLILLFLDKKEYKVIHDVKIFFNGLMSQIDHIIISRYGIFVIETKNYKGWIFGSENSYEWTQVLYKKKYKLYNPLKQNLGHVRALKGNLSQFPSLYFYPIVVFTGSASLKVNSSYPVIKSYQLLKTIKSLNDIKISQLKRDEIYNFLLKINGNRPNVVPKNYEEHNNLCPRCESELVLRNGKNGNFYGCSKYPKCYYTKGAG